MGEKGNARMGVEIEVPAQRQFRVTQAGAIWALLVHRLHVCTELWEPNSKVQNVSPGLLHPSRQWGHAQCHPEAILGPPWGSHTTDPSLTALLGGESA